MLGYDLDLMDTFRWVFAEVYVIVWVLIWDVSLKLQFSLLDSAGRFSFVESFLLNFVISFFTLAHVPLKNFIPCLIKKESCSSSQCIFQSVFAFNTRSTKTHRRSVAKVLIMPLVKFDSVAHPAETGVFKASLGRLKKVTTSYNQTRRR